MPDLFLSLPALCHIQYQRNNPLRILLRVAYDGNAFSDPNRRPVFLDVAVFDRESWRLAGQHVGRELLVFSQIVRMDKLVDGSAAQFVQLISENGAERRICVHESSIRRNQRKPDRCV